MTRYSWKDVRSAAMRYERAVRTFFTIDEDHHVLVEPGSVTNGITAVILWRDENLHIVRHPIPGGPELSRSARESFDMLADRARVLEDIAYEKGQR